MPARLTARLCILWLTICLTLFGCAARLQSFEGSLEQDNGQLILSEESAWRGQLSDGRPKGFGTLTRPEGRHLSGYWLGGAIDGQGTLHLPALNSIYLGEFNTNLRSGLGRFVTQQSIYTGYWQGDVPHGFGTFKSKDHQFFYAGHWNQGLRWGEGLSIDMQQGHYQGEWEENLPHGFGESIGSDGAWYQGAWLNGKMHGYGRQTTSSGVAYEGTWEHNVPHGYGAQSWIDGSRYEGHWVHGEKAGQGTLYLANGDRHTGAWQTDQPQGFGQRHYAAGYSLIGVWETDLIHRGEVRFAKAPEAVYEGVLRRGDKAHPALLKWLKQHTDEGLDAAALLLAKASTWGQPPQEKLEAKTKAWLHQAADSLPEAAFWLAKDYLDDANTNQRQRQQALAWLQRAADEGLAEAHLLLGNFYYKGEQVNRNQQIAKAHFSAATQAGNLTARNNLAWLLATTTKDQIRNGERALALILPLVQQLPSPQHFDTLAAVYAENGQFKRAVSIQKQLLQQGIDQLGFDVQALSERLELYRQAEPWRE